MKVIFIFMWHFKVIDLNLQLLISQYTAMSFLFNIALLRVWHLHLEFPKTSGFNQEIRFKNKI